MADQVRPWMEETERDQALTEELDRIDERIKLLRDGQNANIAVRDQMGLRIENLEKAFAQLGIAYVTLASASGLAARQARKVGLDFDDPKIRYLWRRGLETADAELELLRKSGAATTQAAEEKTPE